MAKNMNFMSQNSDFPLYTLFPNPAKYKVGGNMENQTTIHPPIIFQNEGSPRSKVAPIGTGRPLSKQYRATTPNFDQYTIQTQTCQCCIRSSTLNLPNQIDSTFEQTRWISQLSSATNNQYYTMPPMNKPNERDHQNYNRSANFTNGPFHKSTQTVCSSLAIPGPSNPIRKHERKLFFTSNPDRSDANQYTRILCTNKKPIFSQPPPGALDDMEKQEVGFEKGTSSVFPNRSSGAIPKQRESLFPGQSTRIRILKRPSQDAVPKETVITEKSDEINHNGSLQRGSAQPVPTTGSESAAAKRTPYVIYNSRYRRRSKSQNQS